MSMKLCEFPRIFGSVRKSREKSGFLLSVERSIFYVTRAASQVIPKKRFLALSRIVMEAGYSERL